jgi:hypothetical protein
MLSFDRHRTNPVFPARCVSPLGELASAEQ